MSSDEDFDATPDVRQAVGMVGRVHPYMFEPMARPITPAVTVADESIVESTDNSSDCHASEAVNGASPVPNRNAAPQDHQLMTRMGDNDVGPVREESSSFEPEWCVHV